MSSAAVPAPTPWLLRGFRGYLRRYLGRHFHAVRLSSAGLPPAVPDGPLVVFANHPSWWDPMLFFLMAAYAYPGRQHYGPMDAAALSRYRVLTRLGVYPVSGDGPRAAAQFVRSSRDVLQRPGGTVWMTPQGRFADCRERPLRLRPGLAHLARRVPGCALVPLALELTFWNERTPEALLRFGEPLSFRHTDRVRDIDARCRVALEGLADALAVEAQSRDARRFVTVLQGDAGVGGVYDLGRRVRGWVAGRRPQLSHEPGEDESPEVSPRRRVTS